MRPLRVVSLLIVLFSINIKPLGVIIPSMCGAGLMRSATVRGAAVNSPHFQVWPATENFEIPPMPAAQALFESQAPPIPCVPREVPAAMFFMPATMLFLLGENGAPIDLVYMFFPPAARRASGSR